jgi:hypothetical protein
MVFYILSIKYLLVANLGYQNFFEEVISVELSNEKLETALVLTNDKYKRLYLSIFFKYSICPG